LPFARFVDGMDELIIEQQRFGTSQTNVFTVPDRATRSGNPEDEEKQKKARNQKDWRSLSRWAMLAVECSAVPVHEWMLIRQPS
jgi:hypothetical protein